MFGHFDGREWRAYGVAGAARHSGPRCDRAPLLQVQGPPLRHEVTLEPLKLSVMPMLEATAAAPQIDGYPLQQRDDLTWTTDRPIFERLRFVAEAHPRFRHGPLDPVLGLQDHVELPPGYNPRTLEWAAALRRAPAAGRCPHAGAGRAEPHRARPASATRWRPALYGEADPRSAIDEFWLDRREGFCEHFAAAFVVVMRALDIPARIVTGYQGIDPEPVDGYWLVRQSAAHAWAEYWQAGSGWIRADPTAAVAPERIRGTLTLRADRAAWPAKAGDRSTRHCWPACATAGSAVDNRWNQWVLSYGRSRQLGLLRSLGFDAADWQDLALLLLGTLSVLAGAVAGWAWWDRARVDPWQRQRERIRRRLAALGIASAEHEPPRALAARVRERLGERGRALAALLELLDLQRYGPAARSRPDPSLTRRVRSEARAIARASR